MTRCFSVGLALAALWAGGASSANVTMGPDGILTLDGKPVFPIGYTEAPPAMAGQDPPSQFSNRLPIRPVNAMNWVPSRLVPQPIRFG